MLEAMFIYGAIFAGPVLGLLAFLLFLHPALRPVRLARTIGSICLLMSAPVGTCFLTNTGYPLLILRPGTAFVGLLASVSYLVLQKRHALPLPTIVPPITLLIACLVDAVSVVITSNPGFAGAWC